MLGYAIKRINEIEGKTINNGLITNGYSMPDTLVDIIKSYPHFSIQITLDGNRDTHNSIKKTQGGKDTFDDIWGNIRTLTEAIPEKLNIRINVSSSNFEPYKALIDDLYEAFGHNIHINLAAVFDGQKKSAENELEDILDIAELLDYARSKGYNVLPSVEYAPCIASTRNAFALDEKLNIYSCPAQLYQKAVGTITDDAQFRICDNGWYDALYKRPSCVETCIYGGLCYGGCFMSKRKCKKPLFDRLLPYVISKKIEDYKNRVMRNAGN